MFSLRPVVISFVLTVSRAVLCGRNLPALISLDQSTVCQVCHLKFGRMVELQRHLASAHGDRSGTASTTTVTATTTAATTTATTAVTTATAATAATTTTATATAAERPPASTVDTSAIADPSDTCATVLPFRTRLTAPGPAGPVAAAAAAGDAVYDSDEQRMDVPRTAGGGEVTRPAGGDCGSGEAQRKAVLGTGAGVMTVGEGGASGPAGAREPRRTLDGTGRPGDAVAPAAVVRHEGDETPPMVIEQQQQGEQSWAAEQRQQQQQEQLQQLQQLTGQETAGAIDQATKFKCEYAAANVF